MSIEPPTPLNMSGETSASRLVERVVRRQAADVGARGPLLAHGQLPVELRAAVLGLVVPVALLEADDPEPGLGQAEGDDAARGAGTDDEHVRGFA